MSFVALFKQVKLSLTSFTSQWCREVEGRPQMDCRGNLACRSESLCTRAGEQIDLCVTGCDSVDFSGSECDHLVCKSDWSVPMFFQSCLGTHWFVKPSLVSCQNTRWSSEFSMMLTYSCQCCSHCNSASSISVMTTWVLIGSPGCRLRDSRMKRRLSNFKRKCIEKRQED